MRDPGFEHEVVDESRASYRPVDQTGLAHGRVGAELDRDVIPHGTPPF